MSINKMSLSMAQIGCLYSLKNSLLGLQSPFWSVRLKFRIYLGLERKLAIVGNNFPNWRLILLWEHCANCVSLSPSFRLHPSEMRPCSHRRCSDEGGSSHPQEVKCRHAACGPPNKPFLSVLDHADFSFSFTVFGLSGIAESFTNTVCLWHAGWLKEGWRWLGPREEWVHKLISCVAESLRALSPFICCMILFFHLFFGICLNEILTRHNEVTLKWWYPPDALMQTTRKLKCKLNQDLENLLGSVCGLGWSV